METNNVTPLNAIDAVPPQAPATDRRQNKHRTDAVLELLAATWPACFSIWEKRRQPLKIGIHLDILAALDGAVTPAELSRALRFYVANNVYRSRLVAGAARVDLNGEPAGEVTVQQVTRQAAPRAPRTIATSSAPRTVAPPRISLADLREAARRRHEMEAVS
jgi:ProP effector